MAFPSVVYTDNESAGAALTNNAAAANLSVSGLQPIAQLQSVVANLLVDAPSIVDVPAGDIVSGTFGSSVTPADTGTYVFPSQVGFGTKVISTTALVTPAAVAATTAEFFASTVSGATLMGYGTTGDVTLKNRAGTDVIVVTSNTTGVTLAGALAMTGALSGVTTLAASSTITVTSASAVALAVGLAGATNPAFVVDSSTGTQAAGLKVTGAVAAGTVAAAVISSGSDASLTINAKGTGTIGIGTSSTGAVSIVPILGATLKCLVSTTAGASLNLGNAGTAPTSPNNGDMWIEGDTIKVRLAGSTVTITTS